MKNLLFIDIGANVGKITNAFIDVFHDFNYRVYAFEPLQSNFDKLISKFSDNDRVTLIKKGIASSQQSNIPLYLETKKNLGHSIYNTKRNVNTDTVELIDTVMFSEWFTQVIGTTHAEFDLVILKVNIEGAEYDLFLDLHECNMLDKFNYIMTSSGDAVADMKKCSSLIDHIDHIQTITHNVNFIAYKGCYNMAVDKLKIIKDKLIN